MIRSALLRTSAAFAIACSALAGCGSMDIQNESVSIPGGFPGLLAGYLAPEALPNSLALDEEISRRSFVLRDTPRWTLATSDADLSFPHAAGTFSCVLKAPVSEADTPRLYRLLRRTLTDLGGATYAAKTYYNRARPFVWNKQPLCTPQDQTWLEKDGSYPSGHTAAGWGWALILTEILPAQTDAILSRGRSFGESRNVCNVHWHSDVVQARNVAAGVIARLHAEPAFRADLAAAKVELDAVRSKGQKPIRDCTAEAAALAMQPALEQ